MKTDQEKIPCMLIGVQPVFSQSRVHGAYDSESDNSEQQEGGNHSDPQMMHLRVFVAQHTSTEGQDL